MLKAVHKQHNLISASAAIGLDYCIDIALDIWHRPMKTNSSRTGISFYKHATMST